MNLLKTKKKWLPIVMAFGILSVVAIENPLHVIGNTETATEYASSGIQKVEYQLSGATTRDWTQINVATATSANGFDLLLTQPGVTHMLVAATDNAGNLAMEVKAFLVGDDGIDEVAPMKNVQYRLSGATTKAWTTYTAPFTLVNEGVTTIDVLAEDMAGNQVTVNREVKIDKSAPINNGVTITL